MAKVTEEFANFIAELRFSDLPENVTWEMKRLILDSIGCSVDGLSRHIGRISVELAKKLGGPPDSMIIGTNTRVSSPNAAFANGQTMNSNDYDSFAALHDTCSVVPAALVMAEAQKVSGKDLILALALGQEVSTRTLLGIGGEEPGLGSWLSPIPSGHEKGKLQFPPVYGHSHATLGAVSSAGKLLGLSRVEIINALGIAASICPPNIIVKWEYCTPAQMTKYGIGGWGAQAGVTAALLAKMGFTGDPDVFGGKYGYWRYTGSNDWTVAKAISGLGNKWLHKITYKYYPGGGCMQNMSHIYRQILEDNDLRPEDIQKVKAYAWPVHKFPLWKNNKLGSPEDAYWNPTYHISLITHGIGRKHWNDEGMLENPKIRQFMDKVQWDISYDEEEWSHAKLQDPGAAPVRLEVTAKGKVFKGEMKYTKGASSPPEISMTDEDLSSKFKENASGVLSAYKVRKILKTIFELEEQEDITKLFKLLVP